MMRFLTLVMCAFMIASCNNNSRNVVLTSLNRSEKMQLFCADVTLVSGNLYHLERVLPSEICTSTTTFAPEVHPQILGAVTQRETGEVAMVSFTNSVVFDTNRTVPGVTALRVGEQPTGIQISPVESSYTYVSSFSPKSVQAIPTKNLVARDADFLTQQVRFDAGPTDLALHELVAPDGVVVDVNADGEVTSATGSFVYRYLYAAIPELGQIAQIPVISTGDGKHDRLDEAGVKLFTLNTYTCASIADQGLAVMPPMPPTNDDYQRICPQGVAGVPGRDVKPVNTEVTCSDGPGQGPSPIALTIDHGLGGEGAGQLDDVLLVADANQPVIHRFRLGIGGATPIDPIISGTPTFDVSVTPYVPASSDPSVLAATQRYVYAVSATDSSVLAIDYTEDPANPYFGAVLPVVAGLSTRANEENVESRNRVRSGYAGVRSIDVVSPFYNLEPDPNTGGVQVPAADLCKSDDSNAFALAQNANNMRGVFLAVSLSNGAMFFLDVYDLNAPCRGGAGAIACTPAETGPDRYASIRRHRRRFAFTPNTFISIDGTPSIQFETASGQINPETGEPTNSSGPGLKTVPCPSSMFNIYGDPVENLSEGLICASSQVWSSFTQRWDATWAGLIPNSEGGLGLFSDTSFEGTPGNWFLAGDVPFCEIGVLGHQDGEVSDKDLSIEHLTSYVGDRLLITGELPPSTLTDPNCEAFTDLKNDIENSPVWFPILTAFNDQLEIGPSPNPKRYTLDQVKACFNQFTEYQIHTQGVYTVTGTATGFIHNVIADEVTGACIYDGNRPDAKRPWDPDDVDTYLTGRAFAGTQFINPLVSFRIGQFGPDVTLSDTTVALLNLNVLNQFGVLLLDTSTGQPSLPASMLFSEEQDQLFFVDFQVGVRRIIFSPLSIVQTFN
jgi:hypothetical protein